MNHTRQDVTVRDYDQLARSTDHELALDCLLTGIQAAHPKTVIGDAIAYDGTTLTVANTTYDLESYDRLVIVGGGNAAGQVAAALEQVLGDRIDDGVVVTDDPTSLSRIDCIEGNHPVPEEQAVEGTKRVLELARNATSADLVLGLITGGGSALLPAPTDELSLSDLQIVTESLLVSGATIDEINAVRKHCSEIKGGRLAQAAAPATTVGLVFSDVDGDDLSVISSGPLVPDDTTFSDAMDVFERYDIDPPEAVRQRFEAGIEGERTETPTAEATIFNDVTTHVLANNFTALEAASEVSRKHGYNSLILSSRVRGEAREVAKMHASIAEEVTMTGHPIDPPAVVLSGGETTVTVTDTGKGGPNQEFALSTALELDVSDAVVGSVDTDGIDGNADAAGGLVDDTTITDDSTARSALQRNDAYTVLKNANALIQTGQTGTNVNDLRVIVIPE